MVVLAYIFIIAFIMLFGGIFFGGKPGEKPYGFLFAMFVILGLTGLALSLGTLGVLPELVW